MNKLGLCVRYDCYNFGSMLQILSTQRIIESIGWKYEIIRYDKRTPLFVALNIGRIFNPYFTKGKIKTFMKNVRLKKYPQIRGGDITRRRCFAEYRRKYIGPYSVVHRGYDNLVKAADAYDAILVGSDQLWTPAGIKSKFYNLLFVPDGVKKISFATSFGVSSIPKSQRRMTSHYLSRIDYISVREVRGREIIHELTGRDATVALDPTMLFSGEEWLKIFPNENQFKEPYILAYFLGENPKHRDIVNQLKNKTGLKIITIPFMDTFAECDLDFGDEKKFDVGPIEFLNLIRNAEFVCTDSFHGSVFSILNHKKFITFNRTRSYDKLSRNSRIDSLFEILDLRDRRFNGNKDIYECMLREIDYDQVDDRLNEQRNNTLTFLQNALNG